MIDEAGSSLTTPNERKDNNLAATGLMAMAVIFFALIPLFISIGRANNPFLISSAIRVGMVFFVRWFS